MTLLTATAPSRDELRAHVLRTRIAGDVATTREHNLGNIEKMLSRAPDYWFGAELDRDWSYDEVLAVLAERVGIDPDGGRRTGADRIDPDRCIDGIDAVADRLAEAARNRARLLFATGHPTGLLPMFLPVVQALADAGCEVLTPLAEASVMTGEVRRRIRYLGGVAVLSTGGDLLHTHLPEPMQAILEAEPAVDLVVADHGWAGAAGQAGIPTIGFADSNDPALFVAAEEGKLAVAVPLDDNVAPVHYAPVAAYLVDRLRRPA